MHTNSNCPKSFSFDFNMVLTDIVKVALKISVVGYKVRLEIFQLTDEKCFYIVKMTDDL